MAKKKQGRATERRAVEGETRKKRTTVDDRVERRDVLKTFEETFSEISRRAKGETTSAEIDGGDQERSRPKKRRLSRVRVYEI
ncbi:MAG: hypothetical protein IJ991_05155 [Thermoguttaceae bacterium]|nr:hypothetical protein [Thermoguttaceae bacterium]